MKVRILTGLRRGTLDVTVVAMKVRIFPGLHRGTVDVPAVAMKVRIFPGLGCGTFDVPTVAMKGRKQNTKFANFLITQAAPKGTECFHVRPDWA